MKNRVRDTILRRSALIISLILVLGAVALLRIVNTHKDVEDVAEIDLPLIEVLTRIETNQLEQSINFERAVRYASESHLSGINTQNFVIADSAFRYLAELVDRDLLEAEEQVSRASEFTQQESQKGSLRILLLYIRKLEADHTSYENGAIEVLDLLEQGRTEEALILTDKVEVDEDQFNTQVEGVLMRHEIFTENLMKEVERKEVVSMELVVTLTLIFVIFSLIAVYLFSFRIWGPLEDIREGAERLGSGNFEKKMKLRSNSITEDIVDSFNSMAEKLEKAQGDIDKFINFSYRTAHDLKAPIKNMKSLLGMLDRDKISSSHYDTVLNNARRSAVKLETTVNALVEFNKVREQLGTQKEMLDFDTIFKDAVGNLVTQIKEADAKIVKDFSGCPTIFYPRPHLKSILQNLLSNAIKYRDPDKDLVIKIKSIKSDGHVVLLIQDNGLGFDSIKQGEEIMKPFVRLHSHTEGTGLGMYIINTILGYHKGSIRMESEPKKGARFYLKLN
ncbi:MAG: HAMP domain-containing sensor histidine kinase [Cyclobacteriaceae bacterium]